MPSDVPLQLSVLKFIHVVGPRVAEFVAFTLRRSKHTRCRPATSAHNNQPANGSLIEGSFAVILEGSDAIVISNITLIRRSVGRVSSGRTVRCCGRSPSSSRMPICDGGATRLNAVILGREDWSAWLGEARCGPAALLRPADNDVLIVWPAKS